MRTIVLGVIGTCLLLNGCKDASRTVVPESIKAVFGQEVELQFKQQATFDEGVGVQFVGFYPGATGVAYTYPAKIHLKLTAQNDTATIEIPEGFVAKNDSIAPLWNLTLKQPLRTFNPAISLGNISITYKETYPTSLDLVDVKPEDRRVVLVATLGQ